LSSSQTKTRTLRSSLLPNGDSVARSFDSVFLGSAFFGSEGFEGGEGGVSFSGLEASSFDFGSSFFGSGSEVVGLSPDAGSFAASPPSSFPPSAGLSPSSSLTISCPTVTVSSSLARNSLIVPAAGALTATSIYTAAQQ
jgi:hypothetical protein